MSIEKKEEEIKDIKDICNEKKEISDETIKTMNIINETYKKFSLTTYNIEELNKFKDNILSLLKERDKIYIDKLIEYKGKTDKIKTDFDSTNKITNSKFSKIIDNQARMTSRLDQLKNYETFVATTNDKIISHEVRLNNIREDFSNATQKYDKIYLDNLELPGYIGRCAKYKNCQNFFLDVIKDLAKLNQYREKNILDLKMYKEKLETIINSMNTILDNNNESQLKYINETKEKILKDCNSMFEAVCENMKEIRVDNSKYAVDLITQSMDLSKKWDKIEKIRDDLLEKFNYSVNKYQMLTDDTIKSFDDFKIEYGVIRRKFMELAEFIKDVRFRKNIGENVKKNEIKIMVKKMLRRKKSFEGKDVHLLNDINNIENIDYKKYYNIENNDDERSNSLKLIQNKKNGKYTPSDNPACKQDSKNKNNKNNLSKESNYKRDINKSVEDIHTYKKNNKNSLTSCNNKNNNTNAEMNNRSMNISNIYPVNLKNIKNNAISVNKSAIINNGNINYKSEHTIDIKFRNDISQENNNNKQGKDQDIISIKAYNDRNSKEKIEIQEKEKRDEFMINKYNNNKTIKPNEIIKNNEINYNNKSNEINTKNNNNNNYNKNYNSQQSEINSGKDENNYISTSNEKKYDIKDYMQNVNQNINKKQEEEKPNKNKIIENNNSTPEKQQFNNNYEINRQDINIQNIQNNSNKILSNDLNRKEKNDMPIQTNNNSVSKNDGVINEISIAANMNDKITKKKDETSQISLTRAMSHRSNNDIKPTLIDDTSSTSSEVNNTNLISARNFTNNIGLSSEKSLSCISENYGMNTNNNINKFLMNDIQLENNDKIIKELASELEQSTAKKDMLASNKKEIEQKFKNACSNIEPINLLDKNNNNNCKNNFNSNSEQNSNENNNINNIKYKQILNFNHTSEIETGNQDTNSQINNNNNETERERENNINYNTSINVNELHPNINERDTINNSNINIMNTINKSADDLQYRTIPEINNKYSDNNNNSNNNNNNNNNKNIFNRSINDSINNLNPIKLNNEIYINDNFNSNTFNKKLHAVDQKLLNLELYTKEKILDLISQINLIKHTCNLPTNESFIKDKSNLDLNKISHLSNNKNSFSNPKYKTFNSNLNINHNQNHTNNNNTNISNINTSNTNTCNYNQQNTYHLDKNKENFSNNKENNRNLNNINNSKSQYILNNIDKKRYSLREVNPKYSLSNQKISRKNKLDYNFVNNKNLENIIQNNNLTENNNGSGDISGRIKDVFDGNNRKIMQSINSDANSKILKEFEKKNFGNILKNNNDNKEEFSNRSLNYGTNNFAYSNSKFKGTEIKLVDLNKLVDHQLPRNRLIPIRINNNDYFVSSNNK